MKKAPEIGGFFRKILILAWVFLLFKPTINYERLLNQPLVVMLFVLLPHILLTIGLDYINPFPAAFVYGYNFIEIVGSFHGCQFVSVCEFLSVIMP